LNTLLESISPDVPDIIKESIHNNCREGQRVVLEATLNTDSTLLIDLLNGGIFPNPPIMYQEYILDLRKQIMGYTDNNEDLPRHKFPELPHYFKLKGATPYQITCLLSPVKVAETLMGRTNDLWNTDEDAQTMRRTINFYRSYFPKVYAEVLMNVVKMISNQQK
jgi:hypothetical protein